MSEQNKDDFSQLQGGLAKSQMGSSVPGLPPETQTNFDILREVSRISNEIKTHEATIKNQQEVIAKQQFEIDRNGHILILGFVALLFLFLAYVGQSWGDREKSYGDLIEKIDNLSSQLHH